jgi:putative oxidoreductase
MNSTASPNLPSPGRLNLALFILRLASALAFLYHGSGIFLHAQQFSAAMHWPALVGYLVGLAQLAGGLAMLTGILIRVGSACIIAVMLGAIFLVHLPHGYDVSHGGMEYALTQLLIAFAILLTGGGGISLASWLPAPLRKL